MKTGIELIAQERQEQIEKHGWDIDHDASYSNNELIKAAMFCINPEQFEWPYHWDEKFRDKILAKSLTERMAVAGAFIAANIDQIHHVQKELNVRLGRE